MLGKMLLSRAAQTRSLTRSSASSAKRYVHWAMGRHRAHGRPARIFRSRIRPARSHRFHHRAPYKNVLVLSDSPWSPDFPSSGMVAASCRHARRHYLPCRCGSHHLLRPADRNPDSGHRAGPSTQKSSRASYPLPRGKSDVRAVCLIATVPTVACPSFGYYSLSCCRSAHALRKPASAFTRADSVPNQTLRF